MGSISVCILTLLWEFVLFGCGEKWRTCSMPLKLVKSTAEDKNYGLNFFTMCGDLLLWNLNAIINHYQSVIKLESVPFLKMYLVVLVAVKSNKTMWSTLKKRLLITDRKIRFESNVFKIPANTVHAHTRCLIFPVSLRIQPMTGHVFDSFWIV